MQVVNLEEIIPEYNPVITKFFAENSIFKNMKYRKKPVVIEAVQWNGNNYLEIAEFCGNLKINYSVPPHQAEFDQNLKDEHYTLTIPTLEGNMTAIRFDYIIKGVQGEFYPCKPDIFEQTYEKV